MADPLTKLEHRWVAMEMTPVDVYRRPDGEVVIIRDPEAETEIQVGCGNCDASPKEGWHTVCQGNNGQD